MKKTNIVLRGEIPPDENRNRPLGYAYVLDGGFLAGHLTDYPEYATQGEDPDDFVANLLGIYDMVRDGSLETESPAVLDAAPPA
jgi:hypothetical protein